MFHTCRLGSFGLVVRVVDQLEEGFFILQVELRGNLEGAQFGKELQSLPSQAGVVPVVVLLVEHRVKLLLERLAQHAQDLLQVALDVQTLSGLLGLGSARRRDNRFLESDLR